MYYMSIISFGSNFMVLDGDAKVMKSLPKGTFHVTFSPMSGYGLEKLESEFVIPETQHVFGRRDSKVDMIEDSYKDSDRSVGVMLTGEKGIGKTLFSRMVATRMRKHNMPTIIVDGMSIGDASGLANFLDTLPDDVVIMFDEYEKVFNEEKQNALLGLFDGTSVNKRMYIITANNTYKLNDYIKGRPGRFLFDIKFNFLNDKDVEEYLNYYIPDISESELGFAKKLASIYDLNYDMLNALVRMHKIGYSFLESIETLNLGLKNSDEKSRKTFAVDFTIKDKHTGEVTKESSTFNMDMLEELSESTGSKYFRLHSNKYGYDSTVTYAYLQEAGDSYIAVNPEFIPDEDETDVKSNQLEVSVIAKPKPVVGVDSRLTNLSKTYGYE